MNRQLLRSLPAFPLALILVYTNSVYYELPSRMPTHWGINGQPNGWSPRIIGAWLLPCMMVFVWGLSIVLPKLDSRKANYEKFGVAYNLVVTAIVAFEAVVQWAMLNVALGHAVNINTVVYISVGALFAILGAAMPFTKPTRYFGIRTKWTLSDDTVWARTHKAAGYLMVAAGVFTISAGLDSQRTQATFVATLIAILTASLGSVGLSYYYWRKR